MRHVNGVEGLGQRANLVQLHQQRVRGCRLNPPCDANWVGDKQVVADDLNLRAQRVGDRLRVTDRLLRQRHAIAAYRDTPRLLLTYAADHTGVPPSRLDIDDLDTPVIGAFLDHLEHDSRQHRADTASPSPRPSDPPVWQPSESPPTSFATPPRCDYYMPASTPPSSRCGSATKASKRHGSTCFADPDLKERAIARTQPLGTRPSRYRPPDNIIAWLEAL